MTKAFEDAVRSRYEREVISGTKIVHDGDCDIFRVKICTCGLLHMLRGDEESSKIYPKYDEEIGEHERRLDYIQRHP